MDKTGMVGGADKQKKFHYDHIYFNDPQVFESILLLQIGDLSCDGGYVIGEHVQFCYEISYIVSGKGVFYRDGIAFPVKAGDVMINLPGERHDGKADPIEPFRYFYVGFNFTESMDGPKSLVHIKKMFDRIQHPVMEDDFGIHGAFVSIFNELINLNSYSSLMIETNLYQIVVMAYRNFFESRKTDYSPQNKTDESKKIVYEVIHFIDYNLHKISELTQIAVELHYSYSYISHLFSKEVGLTIKEYYNRKRFEKAVEWLKTSDMNITQIAEKLHYQSIHTFSKAFSKNFGISPSEYQSLYANRK
ncbi:helix-turn-helix transcriptional regulator [Paenibacillus nasutitermitis]|uniref:HTH araC/xylS-type domain-containing protein n=1 Tax=Paenibacillus nasutitermitis TaxID=1652958 RepID=A0A916Z3X3_9BACL|nr:AraC family transcriptional regulator [Paenibacillus nasutitermitis]GGD75669.1 hypothetical protein GCM10010911_37070 [Paenibacillus nasutitermitis]